MSSSAPCAPSKITSLPASSSVRRRARRVGDVLLEAVAVGQVLLGHRLQVERAGRAANGRSISRLGSSAAMIFCLRIFSSSRSCTRMPEARRLVGVAGADAALASCRSQLAELRLARVVEHQVVRHDQVRVGADRAGCRCRCRARAGRRSRRSAPPGRSTTPLPITQQLARVEDPRRDQVELERLARRGRSCARRCCRPGSARRRRRARRAGRRPCPCPRRPTGRPRSTMLGMTGRV